MKHDYTDITILLDRSGSMQSVRESTIAGYNNFIEAQAKLPGYATITLLQFDHEYEAVYSGVACGEVQPMRFEQFVPRGDTALLDAIGRTIYEVGARLAGMAEADRPGKVVVVILTDGQENASRKFRREQVKAMVEHQREVYRWDFVFLGANQDAIFTAASLGVPAQASLSYAADANGMRAVMDSASTYIASVRASGSASFEVSDRIAQQRTG